MATVDPIRIDSSANRIFHAITAFW